jgi:NAD-dependent deacetylase sirtuin 5
MDQVKTAIRDSTRITFLTGAGLSAASGIPTFRGGKDSLWRKWDPTTLATPTAFRESPSRVWEFYEYRRRHLVHGKKPNDAHYAIKRFQDEFPEWKRRRGRVGQVNVVTQNVDGLHALSGAKAIEMHGSLWRVRCTECKLELEDLNVPICPGLDGKGDPHAHDAHIPTSQLPHCKSCGGLQRPAVVWFEESLNPEILSDIVAKLETTDVLIIVGTSGVVYPAAGFSRIVSERGGKVIEFNLEAASDADMLIIGPAHETLPIALELD